MLTRIDSRPRLILATAALLAFGASSCTDVDRGSEVGSTVGSTVGSIETDLEKLPGPKTIEEIRRDDVPNRTVDTNDPGVRPRRGQLLDVANGGQPYSGYVEQRSPSGRLIRLTTYVDGRRDGWSLAWHEDGTLRERRLYAQGRKHGEHNGFWSDGAKSFVRRFEDGDYHGTSTDWHSNGQVAREQNYVRGLESGRQRSWAAVGTPIANYVVRDGRRFGTIGSKPCFTVEDGRQVMKKEPTP